MPRLSRKISPSNDYHQQPAQRPPVESKFPSTEEIARPFRGIHEELRPPRRSGEGSRGWRTGIWGRFFVFVAPFFGNGFVHHSFVASKSLKKFFFFTKNHFFNSILHQKSYLKEKMGELLPFNRTCNGWCSSMVKQEHPPQWRPMKRYQSEGILLIELLHVSWPFEMKAKLPIQVTFLQQKRVK